MMFILGLITFGIYWIYWTCSFQNQLKTLTRKGFGGLGHLIMIIVTFGIYYIYWQYACGRRLAILGAKDNSTLYLLLVLIPFVNFFSWLNPYFMQNQANQLNDKPVAA